MKYILLLIASVALSAIASADLKKIQGTWKATAGHMGNSDLPKALLDKMVLKIRGETYDYDEGNGHDYGTLKEVAGKELLAMDIVGTRGPNKGKTFPAIYKLEGTTLTIFYGLDGHRPKSFTERGKGPTLLMTYRRAN